jgi:hypothetical protein
MRLAHAFNALANGRRLALADSWATQIFAVRPAAPRTFSPMVGFGLIRGQKLYQAQINGFGSPAWINVTPAMVGAR